MTDREKAAIILLACRFQDQTGPAVIVSLEDKLTIVSALWRMAREEPQ